MSFLRLAALWALPVVLIPLLIHWGHRRKHPTVPWSAMMFLQRASRQRRGPAKLRRFLILATRMAVLGGIILALARPLSSGLFGLAANRVGSGAIAVVLLDRSPSMQCRLADGRTRQAAGLETIAETLRTLGTDEIVLIDHVGQQTVDYRSPEGLLSEEATQPAASSADLPALFQRGLDYLGQQGRRRADVWLCSDRQRHDWQPDASAWSSVTEAARGLGEGVTVYSLDFPVRSEPNLAVRLTDSQPVATEQGRGVALSVEVSRFGSGAADPPSEASPDRLPVRVTVGQVASSIDVELGAGPRVTRDVVVPVPAGQEQIEGHVAIPADVNPADDRWYFALDRPARPRVALVTAQRGEALPALTEVFGKVVFQGQPSSLESEAWDQLVAGREQHLDGLIWQGPLPSGEDAEQITTMVRRGVSVIFFPGEEDSAAEAFAGVRWADWTRGQPARVRWDDWELRLGSYRTVQGPIVQRVAVGDEQTLVGRLRLGQGSVWFCGADVGRDDSGVVRDGVMLYGLIDEAIAAGHGGANRSSRLAGPWPAGLQPWSRLECRALRSSTSPGRVLSQFGHHAGVVWLRRGGEDPGRLIAINRPPAESSSGRMTAAELEKLLSDVPLQAVAVEVSPDGTGRGVVRELWAVVWLCVIAGLLVEAVLSLPPGRRAAP